MSLRVQCPACGKTLGVPESAAGREGKCNACGSKMVVPKMAAPVAFDPPMAPPPVVERLCPFCSEPIQASAAKCRWCGEYLDPLLRAEAERQYARTIQAAKLRPGFFAMLLSVLLPGLGQWHLGKPGAAIAWFAAAAIGYAFLVIPGVLVHAACVADAGGWKTVRVGPDP